MAWKSLDDMDLDGKNVLTRVDINVPVENGRVTDATRIERIVPTIRDILDKGGKPILMAHFGRPKGQRVDEMSLQPLVPTLAEHIGAEVVFAVGAVVPPRKLRLPHCNRERCSCWRIPAFIRAKRKTMPRSPRKWPPWGMFT